MGTSTRVETSCALSRVRQCGTPRNSRVSRGFTLVEVSVVLVILAVLLAVTLPSLQPGHAQRLSSVANLLANDLRLARSLAIRDGTEFTLTLTERGWKLEHTGSGVPPALPTPMLAGVGSDASTYEVDLALLAGSTLRLEGRLATTGTATSSICFLPTGRTKAFEDTHVWLTWGEGDEALSVPLAIAAPTGFLTHGEIVQGTPPGF